VATGKTAYPEAVLDNLTGHGISVVCVDAFGLAREAGEVRTANIVIVGALSVFLPVEAAVYEQVIKTRVPEKFREVNLRAFAAGRKASS